MDEVSKYEVPSVSRSETSMLIVWGGLLPLKTSFLGGGGHEGLMGASPLLEDCVPPSSRHNFRQAMWVFASACLERMGNKSPVSQIANDQYLLGEIVKLAKEREISYIMVCGGMDDYMCGSIGFRVEIFSSKENRWTYGPNPFQSRSRHGMALVGTQIFMIGGYLARTGITNSVEVLSISNDWRKRLQSTSWGSEGRRSPPWKKVSPMIQKRYQPGVGVIDDQIYVFGGYDDGQYLGTCEVFDVVENQWTMITPMPTARRAMGVAVVGHRIYVIGGNQGFWIFNVVEMLDTKTNTWSTLPAMPTPREGLAVAVIDDRFIWTFGGWDGLSLTYVIEVYDIKKSEWTTLSTKMVSLCSSPNAIVIGDRIWLIGGEVTSDQIHTVVSLLDLKTLTWTKVSPMNVPLRFPMAVGF